MQDEEQRLKILDFGLAKWRQELLETGLSELPGWPRVRLHYAYEFEQADRKRLVVLVTDRTIGMAEAMRSTRSMDYAISAIVMQLQRGEDGKERSMDVESPAAVAVRKLKT